MTSRLPWSYEPELYDLATPESFLGDLEWYRRKARESGGPVLELGAGTGRVALAIGRDGIAIHALEADPGMLEMLGRKLALLPQDVQRRVTPVDGDMRSFSVAERFALIIAPFRTFLHNVSEAEQLACLRSVRAHLRPGGCFAFNIFHPSLGVMAQNAGPMAGVWRWTNTFERPTGGCVVRSEANRYDTVRQRVYSQHRYDEFAPGGSLTRAFLHRLELAYLYPTDVRRLLAASGFERVQIAGGFDGREPQHDTDELVVEAWPAE